MALHMGIQGLGTLPRIVMVEVLGRKLRLGEFARMMQYATLKWALDRARSEGRIPGMPEPFFEDDWRYSYERNPGRTLAQARIILIEAGISDPRVFVKRLRDAGVWGVWSLELDLWYIDALEDLLEQYRYYGDFVRALARFLGVDGYIPDVLEVVVEQLPDNTILSESVKKYMDVVETYKKYMYFKNELLYVAREIIRRTRTDRGHLSVFEELLRACKDVLEKHGLEPSIENLQLALWIVYHARLSEIPEPLRSLIRKAARNIDNLKRIVRDLRVFSSPAPSGSRPGPANRGRPGETRKG